jgi:putative tricarboxylic transport membrane protein
MDPETQTTVEILTSGYGLFLMLLGTALGITVGAIPGLTGAMVIALTLPLTYSMNDPRHAMMLLVAMYVGSVSGGLITATLLRMPGTPASVMTTLDGYPLAKSGQPGRALGLGIMASFVGGLVSCVFLVTLSKPMAEFSTRFGPWEFFSLVMMALVLITSVGGKSLSRALFAGLLGMLCAMPGVEEATGEIRLTMGFVELNGGLKLLPVLIGLFAVSQVISEVLNMHQPVEQIDVKDQRVLPSWKDWTSNWWNMLRSSIIGTWIGILPGIGANIGSVAAYSTAKTFSKEPEKFGKGSEEGVVASEAANNATVGGALIPLVAMGIPGSVIDAILLGALVLHGLQPGPMLFRSNPDLIHTIMGTYAIANVFMFVILVFAVKHIARLTDIPKSFLLPVVLSFCVVGSYSLGNRMFDVWVMLVFGLLGFGMERFKIPLAPFVIGFVLGPIAEKNLSAGLMSSSGDYTPLVTRPISLTFLIVSLAMLLLPLYGRLKRTPPPSQPSED